MTSQDRITPEVAAAIGYYVYVLQDPRDGAIFYVGKGQGERVLQHARESLGRGGSEKLERTRDIRRDEQDVRHLVVRSSLRDESEAFAVEQALIDSLLLQGAPLTNKVKGHGSSRQGLSTVEALVARHGASPMPPVDANVLFVKINRMQPTDGAPEIYERTRGHWKVSQRGREAVTHAAGVAFGVVRGVYRIDSWFPSAVPGEVNRWGFEGSVAPELSRIIGTSVRHLFKTEGSQNPISYYWPGKESGAERPW